MIIPFGRCDYDLDSLHRKWSGGDGGDGALIESQRFLSPPDEPKFDLY